MAEAKVGMPRPAREQRVVSLPLGGGQSKRFIHFRAPGSLPVSPTGGAREAPNDRVWGLTQSIQSEIFFSGRDFFPGPGKFSRNPTFWGKSAHASISTPSPSQKLSSTSFIFIVTKLVLCYIAVISAVITRISGVII